MKTAKRILTVALALMLIFALAAPSFALQTTGYVPAENIVAKYTQLADSNYEMDGTFTVYLSIYSGIYDGVGPIDRTVAVTMGSTGATDAKYTVYDVLNAAESQYTFLDFDTTTPNAYHQSWLQGVKDTTVSSSTVFSALPLKYNNGSTCYCGWMFRINGMLPYKYGSTNTACLITDAYVTANDVVDLYYSNVYIQSIATKVRYVAYLGTDSGVSTFQVLQSECYMGLNDTEWTVGNWTKVANNNYVKIKIDGTVQTIATDADGKFTLSGLSGTHTFQFNTTTRSFKLAYDDTITYKVCNTAGMYSTYTI